MGEGPTEDGNTLADSPRTRGAGEVKLPSRFAVKQSLGEGGMGAVVEAYDRVLLRDVAIKILAAEAREDPRIGTRFLREARAAARLRHPHIIQIHDIDPEGGYIVMELVRGESLSARLWRDKKLPPDEVRRIGTAMLSALAAAHEAGIVHRDVKPANILLGANGEVKLADFGVAYFGDSELTMPGTRVGTPAYMAPEQLRGKDVDARADVYSAGVTLFEAATGERPNDDDAAFDAYAQIVNATGDTVIASAVRRAIRARPADRFANGRGFLAALDATEVPGTPARAQVVARNKRKRWPWAFAALPIVAVAAVASHRSKPAAPEHHTVALLPFADATKNPMLDFAAAGLPNLLGLELHDTPDLTVVGYYQLLGVAGDNAPREAWVGAARKLGADVVVAGEITGNGAVVHVTIGVDTIDGQRLDAIERDAKVEEVPEVVRRAAPALIAAATGRELAASDKPVSFDAERELQLGIAALDREHLPEAFDHLRAAIHHDPDSALAHYYLATTLTWMTPPSDPALIEIDKALATGKLDDAQRGYLAGLRKIATSDNVEGIDVLRPLAEKYPDNRDILYALFESLFHGGRPAEAMAVYRRINALAPRFRLALIHVFTYAVSHGDEPLAAWAVAIDEPNGDTYNPTWEPQLMLAHRDYAGAIGNLSQQLGRAKGQRPDLQTWLAIAYALSDQIELANSLAEEMSETHMNEAAPMLLGLATARGDEAARAKWYDAVTGQLALVPVGPQRALQLSLLAGAQGPVATRAELVALRKALDDALVPNYEKSLNRQLALVMIDDRLGNDAELQALTKAPYPEVSEFAKAAVARRAGDYATAIAAMRHSIEATGDGRFLVDQWWMLARDLRSAGDNAGVLAACDEVIHPRLFLTWAWGSTVGDCLAWTADAADATGKPDVAQAARTQLRSLKAR